MTSSDETSILGRTLLPLAATILVTLSWNLYRSWKTPLPYPPGPPARNLLSGNADDAPTVKPWLAYTQWGHQYGDIIHFRIYGQHTIVLNSMEAVRDLFDRRSNIYSSRPHIEILNLMGWDFNVGLKPYGDDWRRHRRLYQQSFRPAASPIFRPILAKKINDMLYNLLVTPDDFTSHYKTVSAAIIMAVVYGYDVAPKEDYYITLIDTAVGQLTASFLPGASAVNALPILRYLPEWFPGAGFHKIGKATRPYTDQMQNVPLEYVKNRMIAGTAVPCVASELLTKFPSDEKAVKAVCATVYAAGADTSQTSLGTFFIAMATHLDVQKKAQAEIDSVVGPGKLVNFDDHEKNLPYITALCKEIMRWRPALPLGVTHSTTVDDVYKGFYIPKGANVIPNVWALSHDPNTFKDPEDFNPGRYLDAQGNLIKDNEVYSFGFGRRICPGRHMASDSLWLSVASILSVFDIRPKKDASGNDIPINPEYTDSFISHPLPFACSIIPRSQEAKKIILQAVGQKS